MTCKRCESNAHLEMELFSVKKKLLQLKAAEEVVAAARKWIYFKNNGHTIDDQARFAVKNSALIEDALKKYDKPKGKE